MGRKGFGHGGFLELIGMKSGYIYLCIPADEEILESIFTTGAPYIYKHLL